MLNAFAGCINHYWKVLDLLSIKQTGAMLVLKVLGTPDDQQSRNPASWLRVQWLNGDFQEDVSPNMLRVFNYLEQESNRANDSALICADLQQPK